ncbi:hypothetical protein L3N51_02090 [Metallosphaera sp. J1]|uniref:DUF3211 domain-containing protein n=1 Tax=Metallosphaera javensis (ex Hofmann et al. 2022) TaxID=99938 RepID=UPI001EDFDB8C|nr:DUF3211 domain-containing protein [Metallosphaera javensis (ex Hofmann et al. 2022)]MCG3109794.1 hypothetical protein [Metallosphaera javensis (ex Hofmann et al. 2022)]
MIVLSKNASTDHSTEAIRLIMSDPQFVIPRLFPTVRRLEVSGKSFSAMAKYMFFDHEVKGNVFVSTSEIVYPFTLSHGDNLGTGRLIISLRQGELSIKLEYEGWMERFSKGLLQGWLDKFMDGLEEDLRLERIKRKL